jgi:hypothetical protein
MPAVTAWAPPIYTITSSAGSNGLISPAGDTAVGGGSDLVFTATAETGFQVHKWSLDGETVQSGGVSYTLSNIQASHTVDVTFRRLKYDVTGSAGVGGSIDPSGSTSVPHGGDLGFTATADTGYQVHKWSLDGETVQSGGTSYTLENIQADHTVEVTFRLLEYEVTGVAGANGSISPAGTTTVPHGSDLVFTATAEDSYRVDEWSLDGETVQTGQSSYTLENIQANHTVEVTFGQLWFTIDATAGPGGSISPASVDVTYGGNSTFTATANLGYRIDKWFLDGSRAQIGGTTYNTGFIDTDHTVHVTFAQALSHSLGTFDFDDEQEFRSSIVNNSNNAEHPDEALVFTEPVGVGPDPDNVAMVLHNRKDKEGNTVNARAKAAFIKTGVDEILIHFNYLFSTSNVELVIYVSDSPLPMAHNDPLREQHYIEAARLAAPPFPRPGSAGSGRFAVFQKIVWTGSLDFAEGLYIELELVEPDLTGILLANLAPRAPAGNGGSSVYVDNWSTMVQCYGICLDINGDNFVDEADFLMVIGGYGGDAAGDRACLEGAFSTDGYTDSYDVASWDWAMNSDQRLLNYCGLPLTGGSGGFQMMIVPVVAPSGPGEAMVFTELPNDMSDLLVLGKRGPADARSKLRDRLYTFASDGQYTGSFEPTSDRGNIRLIQGPEGELYQLNSETGLLRLDSMDEVIVPPGKLEPAGFMEPRYNQPATVYVGIQGSDADSFGRPLLDAAVDANHVYVVPVVVSSSGGQAYTAAAKLKLLAEGNPPYELVELYDEPPLLHDNQYRDNLREIELDSSGNLYVLNVNSLNESDILWRYRPDGTIDRAELGRPDGDSYVPDPIAMHVSRTTDMLYLASATLDPLDPESTTIYAFSTLGAITLEKSIAIHGMQHVTSMAEDSRAGTLWVAGFSMPKIPEYPNPTRPAFYYPHLASVSFENDNVQLLPLFDPSSHDLALPMSILWTGAVERSSVQ